MNSPQKGKFSVPQRQHVPRRNSSRSVPQRQHAPHRNGSTRHATMAAQTAAAKASRQLRHKPHAGVQRKQRTTHQRNCTAF